MNLNLKQRLIDSDLRQRVQKSPVVAGLVTNISSVLNHPNSQRLTQMVSSIQERKLLIELASRGCYEFLTIIEEMWEYMNNKGYTPGKILEKYQKYRANKNYVPFSPGDNQTPEE